MYELLELNLYMKRQEKISCRFMYVDVIFGLR